MKLYLLQSGIQIKFKCWSKNDAVNFQKEKKLIVKLMLR